MDIEEIERLHKTGKMPDWYYYQVNGKSATENLWEQRQKIKDKILKREQIDRELERYKERRKAAIEAELEKQIEEELAPAVEKALDDLLKDFQ